MSTTTMTEVWTAEELMSKTTDTENPKKNPMLWGVPGYMTKEEVDTFFQFKKEVDKRGAEFKDTVYSFGEVEGEAWALGRWLRARKYVLADVIKMVEEATECRKDAKMNGFYKEPRDALGCEPSLFYAQYPQLYYGSTKYGVPVFISKPGILNVDGMACITTLDGIVKFHWHVMMHDFAGRLQAQKAKDPEHFKKFECFCVLDLNNLTSAQLSRRALAIIKEQAAIDSLCFPETMSKMLIVNAPMFFSATWGIIKQWLDPRTANKIEVISSKKTMEQRLLEFIDAEQLPSDYGGKAKDTISIMNESNVGTVTKMNTKMMYLRGSGNETIDVDANETLEVCVYTRALPGAKFTLTNASTKEVFVDGVEVKHTGTDNENEKSTSVVLNPTTPIRGPCKVKISVSSNGSRFTTYDYLIASSFSPAT